MASPVIAAILRCPPRRVAVFPQPGCKLPLKAGPFLFAVVGIFAPPDQNGRPSSSLPAVPPAPGRAILGRRLRSRTAGFFLAAAKIHMLRDDLGASALIPVVVRPGPDLQPPGDDCQLPLGKILTDKLRRAAPGNDVDKVRFPFAAVLAGIIPVDGQREGRNRSPFAVCRSSGSRVRRP